MRKVFSPLPSPRAGVLRAVRAGASGGMRASARVGTRTQAGANDNAQASGRINGKGLLYPRNMTQIAAACAEDCHMSMFRACSLLGAGKLFNRL